MRDHAEGIQLLAHQFAKKYAVKMDWPIDKIPSETDNVIVFDSDGSRSDVPGIPSKARNRHATAQR